MYRIPEQQKPEKFTETEEDKKLLEKIIRFDYGCKLGNELTEKLNKYRKEYYELDGV